MVKQKVEKHFAVNFQQVLPSDEGKADPKLDEKFLNVIQQAQFEIAFAGVGVHGEKIKDIRVFERLMREIGLRRWQGGGEVSDCASLATMQLRFYLMREHRTRPAMFKRGAGVPEAIGRRIELVQKNEIVSPWQRGNGLRDGNGQSSSRVLERSLPEDSVTGCDRFPAGNFATGCCKIALPDHASTKASM